MNTEEDEELIEIIDFIQDEKHKQKLTLRDLRDLSGVSHAHSSLILNHKRPGVEYRVLARILKSLGYKLKIEKIEKKPGY